MSKQKSEKVVKVSRGRGRPDKLGAAIVGFIKSKPWNGRVVGLNDIFAAYSVERRNMGKLATTKDAEFRCANIHIQNMLRAGKLVRMERGMYTIPEAATTLKEKSKAKKVKSKAKIDEKKIIKSIEAVSAAVAKIEQADA